MAAASLAGTAPITVVIPCGAEKLEGTHAARDLYTSANFRATLAAAEAMVALEGGNVLILSAFYGLLELDEEVASYDVKLGTGNAAEVDELTVAAQLIGLVEGDVYALLPSAYFAKLDAAARLVGGIYPADVYEADAGIGYQRGTVKTIRTTTPAPAEAELVLF
jgi:hypothetical protein